jgi:hypothetical protein
VAEFRVLRRRKDVVILVSLDYVRFLHLFFGRLTSASSLFNKTRRHQISVAFKEKEKSSVNTLEKHHPPSETTEKERHFCLEFRTVCAVSLAPAPPVTSNA